MTLWNIEVGEVWRVGEVWGVGLPINLHLQAAGIKTVKALREASPSWLRSKFGVVMERTGNERIINQITPTVLVCPFFATEPFRLWYVYN